MTTVALDSLNNKRIPSAKLPIEIEYWYVLPVLRRELAKSLKTQGNLKQKEIARILGISESAVSQYLKGTRASLENDLGKEIEIPKWLQDEITESSDKILELNHDPQIFLKEMNALLNIIRKNPTSFLCKIHYTFGNVEIEKCNICLE